MNDYTSIFKFHSFWLLPGVLILGLACATATAQSIARVENVRVNQVNKDIEVLYDLIDAAPDEYFRVWAQVNNADGSVLKVGKPLGMVGKKIRGGRDLRIIIPAPESFEGLTTNLRVEVLARSNLPIVLNRGPFFTPEKTRNILRSALLPGWGLSAGRKGKPYWLIGVAGYGAIGGAVYLNRQADNYYEDYRISESIAERQDLFDKAERADRNSKILAYGAGAIWLGSMIWTFLDKGPQNRESQFELGADEETLGMSLKVNF